MFKNFFGKNVLVTGHTGFKGSWLSIWLDKLGANVTGYALPAKNKNDNYCLSGIKNKINSYESDIEDYNKLYSILNDSKVEIIYHLAAQPLVIESYKTPLSTIKTNVNGTANILEAFRLSKTAKILVVITTDKVYKNNSNKISFCENDILGGDDLYSASKSATEIICNAYNESFFKNSHKSLFTVRAGNVIGGGDWSENRIIPDCVRSIDNKEKIILRNPNSIRPWQHVLEPLGGYLYLVNKVLMNEEIDTTWNFGPNKSSEVNVEYLVNSFINKYGHGEYIINKDQSSFKESSFLSLNINKANKELKWKPILTFDEMIDFTVEWYKNYNNEHTYNVCFNQIKKYEDLWKLRN